MKKPKSNTPGLCFRPTLTSFAGLSTMDTKFGSLAGVCPNRLEDETLHRGISTGFWRFTALRGRTRSKKFFIVYVRHAKKDSHRECKSSITVTGLCYLAFSPIKVPSIKGLALNGEIAHYRLLFLLIRTNVQPLSLPLSLACLGSRYLQYCKCSA